MMKLVSFRVTNFRSIADSGWIETDDVSALIGTNESGKTNLLLGLWKLKPAKDGAIDPIPDYPRGQFAAIRDATPKPTFVQARFKLEDDLTQKLAALSGASAEEVRVVIVARDFDGQYHVQFPNERPVRALPVEMIREVLASACGDIENMSSPKAEESLKASMLDALSTASSVLNQEREAVSRADLEKVKSALAAISTEAATKRSTIVPRYGQLSDIVEEWIARVAKRAPSEIETVCQAVIANMPAFVYYTNYGNLDSEIYLPHVIDNMQRSDLGPKEQAKVRTLKVLFEFVNLHPKEILELGREVASTSGQKPTQQQIDQVASKKKEREILLMSASGRLTSEFREWWQQGNYRFRLNADGDHFHIWVSDDKRPEEIELEGRSAGLQWFLSFYLVFLVESSEGHKGTVLLLDEPGLSLHPVAQRDLSAFFQRLAQSNQLIYTTHSPFLVDADHLDRVKAVYVGGDGTTRVSENLRAGEASPEQTHSIYPVHAALGLSISDTLLQGCQPILVEGQSDQFYLSTIKAVLISQSLIAPKRELIFVPTGGTKGVKAVAPILTGKNEALPAVLLDSDGAGQSMAKSLKDGLYKGQEERIVLVDAISGIPGSEVEDLFATELMAKVVGRYLAKIARGEVDMEFDEFVDGACPLVPQVEAYAASCGLTLPMTWKVEVAKAVKSQLIKGDSVGLTEMLTRWTKLFTALTV